MQLYLSGRIIAATLLAGLIFAGCKKKDDPAVADYALEQLGTIKPETIGFNLAGDPVASYGGAIYLWNKSSGAWERIGTNSVPAGLKRYAQAADGRYYIQYSSSVVLSCSGALGTWDTLQRLRPDLGVPNRMLGNANGDILVRSDVTLNSDSVYYHIRRAGSASWESAGGMLRSSDAEPHFFTSGGLLYRWSGDDFVIYDYMLNTNTGRNELLYDKADPANIPLGEGTGNHLIRGYHYIAPNGRISMIRVNDLEGIKGEFYELDPASLPMKAVKRMSFVMPAVDDGFETRAGNFVVSSSGVVRMCMLCSRYPDLHMSTVAGKVGEASLTLLQHNMPSEGAAYANYQQDAYLWISRGGYLYKWK